VGTQAAARVAHRSLGNATPDGLGQLVWGLSQYSFAPSVSTSAVLREAALEGGRRGRSGSGRPGGADNTGIILGSSWEVDEGGDEEEESGRQQRRLAGQRAWWRTFYEACNDQLGSGSQRALVLMLLGVAGLVPAPPPR
jgi:hypothetical protein